MCITLVIPILSFYRKSPRFAGLAIRIAMSTDIMPDGTLVCSDIVAILSDAIFLNVHLLD